MRQLLLLVLLLLGGCSWSNSMYLARRLSHEAEKTARAGRPFEAQNLWGQARTKADSAWSRSGFTNYEALGYRGMATARLNDCTQAIPDLETALRYSGGKDWGTGAHLALGQCRQELHLPGATDQLLPLLDAGNKDVRHEAALTLAEYYLTADDWVPLRSLAPDLSDPTLRFARAVAGIALNDPVARAELEPFVVARDTARAWDAALEALARAHQPWTDTIVAALAEGIPTNDFRPLFWYFAAYRGAREGGDTAAAARWLRQVERYPNTPQYFQAHRLEAEFRISQVATLAQLAAVIDSLAPAGSEDGGPNSAVLLLRRTAAAMLAERDSISGVPQGDMLLLLQADDALRLLHAPALARSLYARMERDWPQSPYTLKAMLARMLLAPDSADAIRARLSQHDHSPYWAALMLRETPDYRRLEDSLGAYQKRRNTRIIMGGLAGGNQP